MNDEPTSALEQQEQRDRMAKAREAAAAKRKREGMTPAQKEAVARMQAGRRAAAQRRREIKEGSATPSVKGGDGPKIEPAPYPTAPKVEPATPAGDDQAPTAPAQVPPAAPSAPTTTTTTKGGKSWLQRALGL